MKRPLGFMSITGAWLGAATLAIIILTTIFADAFLFSPGALSSASKGRTLGGVTSHAPLGGNCNACHTLFWSPQTMDDRCVACHIGVSDELRSHSGLHGRFVLTGPSCRGCHTDHRGAGASLTIIDATVFPHDLTGYSLRSHQRTAKGAAVTCKECHPVRFTAFDQAACNTCHARLDASFMSKHLSAFGPGCTACHRGFNLGGMDFDHSTAPFKLTEKHASTTCARCHRDMSSLQALRSTPTDCYSCHAADDTHKGKFGRDCGQCHNLAGWGNARFDHGVFPVDHGSREQVPSCATCHPNRTNTYACFGCHAHTPSNVIGKHEGRSLAELANCIRCHRGGRAEGGD